MSKELEVLGKNIRYKKEYIGNDTYRLYIKKNEIEFLEQALQRLEAIDNSKPSEALEELENIEADLTGLPKHVTEYDDGFDSYLEDIWDNVDIIKQALLKTQEQEFNYNNIVLPFFDELVKLLGVNDTDEMLDKIKEQEKVLKIIFEKRVDMYMLFDLGFEEYNKWVLQRYGTYYQLTQEDFEWLKRCFR